MEEKKKPHLSQRLSEQFRRAVTRYLLVETELAPADVGIVFGSNSREALAVRMAGLYHKGLVKTVIVSGGFKGRFPKTEAEDISLRLKQLGVPAEKILVENQARNSGENVIFSRILAGRKLGLGNVRSVIAVGNITASRRFLMTIKRNWPEVKAMIAPVNIYGVSKKNWHMDEKFAGHVLREYRKIPHYKALDYIREVDIERINAYARTKRLNNRPR
tara:strand:- start:1703 stop:2353 length:651 start_codon:yes stop_codon:yes gene_type:complete